MYRRGAELKNVKRGRRRDPRARRAAPGGPARVRAAPRRAERGVQARSASSRTRRRARRPSRAMGELKARVKEAEDRAKAARGRAAAAAAADPPAARRRRAGRARTRRTTSSSARGASRARSTSSRRPTSSWREASASSTSSAACAGRDAVLLPQGRRRRPAPGAVLRLAMDMMTREKGFTAAERPGAGARGGHARHRLLPRRPRAGLPRASRGRTSCFLTGTAEVGLTAVSTWTKSSTRPTCR